MSQYTIPHVIDRSGGSERIVDVYSHLLGNRIIYLGVPIDDGVANTVIAQLLHLDSSSHELPIHMYINSPGGSLTAMTAVYDAMRHVGSPVATTCVGQAVADAAVLLAGGEPGQRSMLAHTGRSPEQIHADLDRDLVLDAEAAKAFGLVDQIV